MPPQRKKWKFLAMRQLVSALFIAVCATTISACGFIGFPGVYKIDIEQGNIIDQETVDQLKPGMSRRQVRFILGTPLVEDTFNQDRWDYVFRESKGNDVLEERRISAFFDGDSLQQVTGDLVPAAFGEPSNSTP